MIQINVTDESIMYVNPEHITFASVIKGDNNLIGLVFGTSDGKSYRIPKEDTETINAIKSAIGI